MAELFAVLLVANGVLLVLAGAALMRERRPEDPTYMPRHRLLPVTDELTRAVNAKRRALRRHPAPWSQTPIRHVVSAHPTEENLMSTLLSKAKSVAAAVGVIVTLGYAALQDKAISFDEAEGLWLALLGLGTVLGVWAVPNKPSA